MAKRCGSFFIFMNIWDELNDCYDEIDYLKRCLDDADDEIAFLVLENWLLRYSLKELEKEGGI